MNLYDFLEYRKVCPLCETQLATSFHSGKQQQIRTEDNRMVVVFNLNALKRKHIDYKVGYSFGFHDDSFQAEFYTQDLKRFEKDTPLFLIDRFRELNKNLKGYCFYRSCSLCRCYSYASSRLDLNLSQSKIEDLDISQESVSLVTETTDLTNPFKIFRMLNDLEQNQTTLYCWSDTYGTGGILNHSPPYHATRLILPIIPFVSKEETTDRIKTLITFS